MPADAPQLTTYVSVVLLRSLLGACCVVLSFACVHPAVATPSPGRTKQQVLKDCAPKGAGIIDNFGAVLGQSQ